MDVTVSVKKGDTNSRETVAYPSSTATRIQGEWTAVKAAADGSTAVLHTGVRVSERLFNAVMWAYEQRGALQMARTVQVLDALVYMQGQ